MSGEDRSLNVDDGEEQEGDNEMQDEDGLEPSDLLDKKISDLQVALEESPDDYDNRIELINLLRKNGDLEALREHRRTMCEKFTMYPEFWLEWIEDEKEYGGDKEVVEELFVKACRDFHSPKIYLEYAQSACGVSIAHAEEVMEEAVSKIGLRYDCSFLIWNSYLDLEKMIMSSMDGELAAERRQKILKLYGRMLRIPHMDMTQSWNDYCAFLGSSPDETVKAAYEKALKFLPELDGFENRLKETSTLEEQLDILCDYVEFEKKGGDPTRIQMAYERALVASASTPNANLWLEYGAWIDFELKLPSVAVDVYSRAVRHSPCAALWQQYFTALERANMASEIDAKWANALGTITTAGEGLALYRTRIYSLRRLAVKEAQAGSHPVDYKRVIDAFDEGEEFLKSRFGARWDSPKAQFRKNYAHFLYTHAKQPKKGFSIWNDILASGSGHMASAWIEASNLERYFGSLNNARTLLYKAVNSASDYPHMAFDALIQFERETGTLEELDKALVRVNAQASRIAARPQKKKLKSETKEVGKSGLNRSKKPNVEEENELNQPKVIKRTVTKKSDEEAAGDFHSADLQIKRPKVVDKDGFAVPQFPFKPQTVGSKEEQASGMETDKEGPSGSTKTVFISNLDYKVPEEKIKEIFPEAKEVRLVYRGNLNKVALNIGYGYVDFPDTASAVKALAMDRFPIDGRPMYVSGYNPHEKGERSEFRYAVGLEKNKIFVQNVHFDATPEQLREVFAGFGVVKDVRIVTHKSGKSRGRAYIEFEDNEAAKNATEAEIVLLSNFPPYIFSIIFSDRKLIVALSNPPKREDQDLTEPNSSEKQDPSLKKPFPSNKQGQGLMKPAALLVRPRNKVNLVPRVVSQRKQEGRVDTQSGGVAQSSTKSEESTSGPSSNSGMKLSNEQFRKFL
ncbi:unnamed protein product [Enterobius vermicularis]|uniref:RRM domain-containing protein n=1 Tax=Enterobius vermicularis TaxID=51028 RepID=A0A0N4V1N6_ENTVE|nr:unnamed protein product [Enterobius vermicularis]